MPDFELISCRHVNFANTTSNDSGVRSDLHLACEPASFGLNDEDVSDEFYHRTGKVGSDFFSTLLVIPEQTNMVIIPGYLLEGADSAGN